MSPVRREGDRKVPIDDWGSHVDRMIREAQQRGEFDNLPGAGKPLPLEDNVYAGEWQSAYRIVKNAGAAPLWIELDNEIRADGEALQALLERTRRWLAAEAARLRRRGAGGHAAAEGAAPGAGSEGGEGGGTLGRQDEAAARPARPARRPAARWWPFGRAHSGPGPGRRERVAAGAHLAHLPTLADLEVERQRARGLYLAKAAELDQKIQDYNTHRPRSLSWLEKPRLLPAEAARRFDAACPPVLAEARQ
jgi:hypothetical protein